MERLRVALYLAPSWVRSIKLALKGERVLSPKTNILFYILLVSWIVKTEDVQNPRNK